jgi:integrase/recombinase XerD
VVSLWLSLKTSAHTRRAYASEASRFLEFVRKPLTSVTLTDLQAWAETLGQGSPASQNRALTAVKSLLSFGHETGYLPFNVGIAIKLRPNRDALAQRILEESEVARLIEAAAPGRNRVLLKLLYVSGVRVSEVCGLKWCDALPRQDAGQITVFGKGGKTRTILLRVLAAAGDGAILAGPMGTTPPILGGGVGSQPWRTATGLRKERTTTLGGQPGRGK